MKASFSQQQFTEHDFVKILLPLLQQNGVSKIDEEDLEKKLYSYYKRPEFSELFTDISAKQGIVPKICLYTALYQEKYFSNNIWFEQRFSNILNLRYPQNYDFSKYEEKLSDDGKEKIRLIAKEISLFIKLEDSSKHKIRIYAINPNNEYLLVSGKKGLKKVDFELISDGEVDNIEPENESDEEIYYESPLDMDQWIQLKNRRVIYARLKNASYAIKQGLCNNDIRYSIIYTELTDLEKLKQIIEIANQKHNDYNQNSEEPYVRRLILK